MSAAFEIKSSKNGRFLFNLKAGNGEVILTSEMYETKSGAIAGIQSVVTNSQNDLRYERKTSGAGHPYFVLKAGNNQVIGLSEMYSSVSAMEAGIAAVKRSAQGAAILELWSRG